MTRAAVEAEGLPFHERLMAMATRLDPRNAEDLVQETWVRAFRGARLYTPGTECLHWLITIMKRVWIDRLRRDIVRPGAVALSESIVADPPAPEFEDLESMLQACDDALRRAVLNLPSFCRDAFVLVVLRDQTYKEAADALGVDVGTAKSRVWRACARIWEDLTWGRGNDHPASSKEPAELPHPGDDGKAG